FFFFQAEDGIRDFHVTGVQTCALPISERYLRPPRQTYLVSMYSSRPYLAPSRPMPDCLTPPKGATAVLMRPVFTPTMPASIAPATRHTRARSREKKYEASPNSLLLAMAIA